jgi:hypothetical protein
MVPGLDELSITVEIDVVLAGCNMPEEPQIGMDIQSYIA